MNTFSELNDLDNFLEDYPKNASQTKDLFIEQVYDGMLRSYVDDPKTIHMLSGCLRFFNNSDIARIINIVSGNEESVSNKQKSDLFTFLSTINKQTEDAEKKYAIDLIQSVFLEDDNTSFEVVYPEEDIYITAEPSGGQDWSGYIFSARLDNGDQPLGPGNTPGESSGEHSFTIQEINAVVNTVHKILITLEQDDGSGVSNGELVDVVGTHYVVVKDAEALQRPSPVIYINPSDTSMDDPVPMIVLWSKPVSGFSLQDLVLTDVSASDFKKEAPDRYSFFASVLSGSPSITIPKDVCTDLEGNMNNASKQFVFSSYDGSSDDQPPVVPNGSLAFSSVTESGFLVDFQKAVDDKTPEADLEYTLYTSSQNNIPNVSDAITNGSISDSGTNVTTLSVSGVSVGDKVWCNIIVEDSNGNKSAYNSKLQVVPDLTSPTLSNASASASGTTITASVSSDEASGTLFYEATQSPTPPSNIQSASQQPVTSTGQQSVQIPGLLEQTAYYIHFLQTDGDGNASNNIATSAVTTGDISSPVLSSAIGTSQGSNQAQVVVTTNETGTLYYLTNQSASLVSASTIKAANSRQVSSTGQQAISISSLSAEQTYYTHLVQEDAAGNTSNVIVTNGYTTDQVPAQTELPDTQELVFDFDPIIDTNVVQDTSLSVNSVSSLTDSSGIGSILSQQAKSNMPVWDNATKTITFDGVDDLLTGDDEGINTDSCYLSIVMRLDDPAGTQVVASFHNNDPENGVKYLEFGFIDGKATLHYGDGDNYTMLQEEEAGDHSQYNIFSFTSDGTTRELKKNGVALDSSTEDYSSSLTDVIIGGADAYYANFDLKTLVAYDIEKSISQQKVLQEHFVQRFISSTDNTEPVISDVGIDTLVINQADVDAKASFTTDEGIGFGYYVITKSATTPSISQIESGNNDTDSAAVKSGQAFIPKGGTVEFEVAGLDKSQTYYIHIFQKDMAGNNSNVITSSSFYTDYEPETTAVVAESVNQGYTPQDKEKSDLNTLVSSLKSTPLWDKLDYFQVMYFEDKRLAKIEIKNSANFVSQDSTNPLGFVPNKGFKGNTAGDGYLNTGFNLKTDTTNYSVNDAYIGLYINSVPSSDNQFLFRLNDHDYTGAGHTNAKAILRRNYNRYYFAINSQYDDQLQFGGDKEGYIGISRDNATEFSVFMNNDMDTFTQDSIAEPNGLFPIGAEVESYPAGPSFTGTISEKTNIGALVIGSAFTQAQHEQMAVFIETFISNRQS